jgi:hypothetical protein
MSWRMAERTYDGVTGWLSSVQQSNPPQKTPCDGVAGAVQDFTGGQSTQSFVDDVINDFVDTKGSGFNMVLEGGADSATSFALFRVGGSIWFCFHPRLTAKPRCSLTGRRPGRNARFMLPPPALLG